jgi:splicing factor 1
MRKFSLLLTIIILNIRAHTPKMWKPATRQITGTNDGAYLRQADNFFDFLLISDSLIPVPLGTRRRFGPAPTEDHHTPQLAQPSPSVYPRQQSVDRESPGKRGRDDSPMNGDPKGEHIPGELT